MFPAGTAPRVFALPPGADFPSGFARGFWRRAELIPPQTVALTQLYVNTRRTGRVLEPALADLAPGPAFLPRLSVIGEIASDPLMLPELPQAVLAERRLLRLMRLVEAYLAHEPGGSPAAAPDLARSLAALIDELDEEGIAPAALDGAVPDTGDLAEHWRRNLAFIDIVRREWPRIRDAAEGGAPDPKARQAAAVEAQLAAWRASPPAHPVIAAGSTGAIATTRRVLAAIARLPQGAVVLPGFDPGIEPAVWDRLAAGEAPEHPMAPFAPLLAMLELAPSEVSLWEDAAPGAARTRLLTEALRPAPVTDAWAEAAPALTGEIASATAGLTLIEAASPRHEAAAIAAAVRERLEHAGETIAIVTPDAALARRISAELAGYGILPDDSMGRPLATAAPAVLMRLIAEIAAEGPEPVRLAGLLAHPLVAAGEARGAHTDLARRYEIRVLRRTRFAPGPGDPLPFWPKSDDEDQADRTDWLARIQSALDPLSTALASGAPLARLLALHRKAAEALSDPAGTGAAQLWDGAAGRELAAFLNRLDLAADAYGEGPVIGYPRLFRRLMAAVELRPDPASPHPRVTLLGPREARMVEAGTLILAGLNEGAWPRQPTIEPWLSRPMRAALGLPPPEREVGLSAHDFLMGAARPRAILTRSLKVGGTPQVAARWLVRLTTLTGALDDGTALEAMCARGGALTALAALTHQPEQSTERAARPAPVADPALRPPTLSISDVETLLRDAYAIYARRILGLRPLEPLGRPPDAREMGVLIHKVAERFARATIDGLPAEGEDMALFQQITEETLTEFVPWPDLRRLWSARLGRAARWFLDGEAARRRTGRPLYLEVSGALALTNSLTVTARADRIDELTDGTAAIYDYKSGIPPSENEQRLFRVQIPLEAEILRNSGFEGVPRLDARSGAYIGLTGSGEGGKTVQATIPLEGKPAAGQQKGPAHQPTPLDQLGAAFARRLRDLIAAYDAGRPWTSRQRPRQDNETGDYDHLARRQEWEDAP